MKSYVIACSTAFRDDVLALARRRGVAATDVALSVLTLVDATRIDCSDDPGEPAPDDRETVWLKTGPRRGRQLTRKPRLQLRLHPALAAGYIRKALSLALQLDTGVQSLDIRPADADCQREAELAGLRDDVKQARVDIDDFHSAIDVIAFEVHGDRIVSAEQAAYVLGFPPGTPLSRDRVKTRFRRLSRIYHPDRPTGNATRMTMLIDAARYLEARLSRRVA